MKIGILINSRNFAGAERVVHDLIKQLIKLSVDISLFVNDEVYNCYLDIPNLRIYNLGKLVSNNLFSSSLKSYLAYTKIKQYLKREKLDLMNIHMFVSPIYFNALKRFNVPYVITLHGNEIRSFIDSKSFVYNILFRPINKSILNKSLSLISVGNWQVAGLSKTLKEKTRIIYNGVDSKIFKPFKIKSEKNVVMFAGRYIDIKGIKELVNVAKQLPQYEFWFAGQGPLAHLIKGRNVKNLGFKTSKELAKLYNQSTICVFPSHREGFGLVGLEAMACEKPVIATPLGFSEYIENGKDGMIIPTKNEKALKDAIIKLVENQKLRERLGKAARKKAERYSWNKVAKQYMKVFKKVINKSKNSYS